MTDLQRRGRRDLVILLSILVIFFLPGTVWGVWLARHDWFQIVPAVALVVGVLSVAVGLWRGDRQARRNVIVIFGLLGALLIFLAIIVGEDVISPEGLAVYKRIGFHPLAALYGAGTVCLLAAAAVAFSTPIRAYWESRRVPGSETASITPPGSCPQQASNAAVAEAVSANPSRPPGECCLACGARMPEEITRCSSCGWTYSASEGN